MNAIIPLIHASLPLYPWKTRFPTFLLQLGRVVLRRNLTMVLDDIVFNGNLDKFSVPPLLQQHVGTGGKILAEASPRDLFWGIGFRAEDKRVSALRYGRDNTFWVTSS